MLILKKYFMKCKLFIYCDYNLDELINLRIMIVGYAREEIIIGLRNVLGIILGNFK